MWLAAIAGPAVGQVTVYTDQASFLAAIEAEFYLETFDTTETDTVDPPLNYSGSGFSYNVELVEPADSVLFPFVDPAGDPNDVFMSTNSALDTIRFDFIGDNVTAVGGFFFAADIQGSIISENVIVGTDQTSPMTVQTGGGTMTFLGFTSNTPFEFLTLIGDSTNLVTFGSANDFIVGTRIVPEPATLGLLMLGGSAMFVLCRRQLVHVCP
jgi:hypothetical protein